MSNPRWKRSIDGASAQSSGKGSAAMSVWSSRLDHYDAVAACAADDFHAVSTGLVFDPVADGQGREHDAQVRFDGFAVW
jgi:hypothetical protein